MPPPYHLKVQCDRVTLAEIEFSLSFREVRLAINSISPYTTLMSFVSVVREPQDTGVLSRTGMNTGVPRSPRLTRPV